VLHGVLEVNQDRLGRGGKQDRIPWRSFSSLEANMTFTWPLLLWLLLLVPIAVVALRLAERRREQTARAFADSHLLPVVVRPAPVAHERWPLGLQIFALALLLFAAARPVASPPLPANKAAVMVAVDSSKSMLADDLQPTRLEASKALVREFVKLAPATTKIGLISFSDAASALVPPTTDRQTLLEALDRVKIAENTSVTSAVVAGVKILPGRKYVQTPRELLPGGIEPPKPDPNNPPPDPATLPPGAILILSDGVSNVGGNPLVAARFAQQNKVKVYTVAVGREGGAVMNLQGRNFFVPFQPQGLQQMAQLTEGKYVFPPTREKLGEIYKELGTIIVWEPTRLEISGLLSGLAVVLMLIGASLSLRWQRRVP
jgi:Ca-activated chloride channel family protein